MEPTLQAGDWILVRKCEPGWTLAWMFGQPHDTHELQNEDDDDGTSETPATESPLPKQQQEQQQQQNVKMNKSKTNSLPKSDGPSTKRRFLSPLEVAFLKSKIQHYKRMMARVNHMSGGQPTGSSFAWFYHSTPVVVPGQVIVLKSPEHFAQRHIKRIVAVGGQWLRQPAQPSLLSMETKPLHHYGTEGRARKQHPSWSSTHRRCLGSRLQCCHPIRSTSKAIILQSPAIPDTMVHSCAIYSVGRPKALSGHPGDGNDWPWRPRRPFRDNHGPFGNKQQQGKRSIIVPSVSEGWGSFSSNLYLLNEYSKL